MFERRSIHDNIQLGILDLKRFAAERHLTLKREWEKAGTKFLIEQMLNVKNLVLAYNADNKPYVSNRTEHLSVSHSHDKLAVILNKKEPTGIDIELIRDKVLNIQSKFLNEDELHFAGNHVETLVTLWAAKETVFKIYGWKEVEFAAHIFIEPFNGTEIIAHLRTGRLNTSFLLKHETLDNYKLVYALREL